VPQFGGFNDFVRTFTLRKGKTKSAKDEDDTIVGQFKVTNSSTRKLFITCCCVHSVLLSAESLESCDLTVTVFELCLRIYGPSVMLRILNQIISLNLQRDTRSFVTTTSYTYCFRHSVRFISSPEKLQFAQNLTCIIHHLSKS